MPIRRLVGPELGALIPPIWGLNVEGELRGPWRELEGLPNMWLMMGTSSKPKVIRDAEGTLRNLWLESILLEASGVA